VNTKQLRQKILDLAIRGKLEDCDTDKWQSVKISDAFIINPRNSLDDELFVSFVSMPLIDSGYTNRFSFEERKWEEVKSGFTHFQDGDVGIAKITPCLENRKSVIFRGLTNGVGSGTTELHIFRIKDEDNITPEYFLWFVKSEAFIKNCVASFTGSVGQKRVGKNAVADMIIPLPPLAEQRRIVAAIESAFAVIDEIERNKAELQAAVTAAKRKILSLAIQGKLVKCNIKKWQTVKISDVLILNPRNNIDDSLPVSFVPMSFIAGGFTNRFTFEERKWGKVKTGFTHFQDGDVGLAKITPCLENRKSVIFDKLKNGVGAGTTELHIFRAKERDTILPEYLLWFLKNEEFINECVKAFTGSVGQKRVGINAISNMLLPLPPFAEQKRIVSAIEAAFEQLDRILENLNVVKV
jgi:restriction endonuclease S subunit